MTRLKNVIILVTQASPFISKLHIGSSYLSSSSRSFSPTESLTVAGRSAALHYYNTLGTIVSKAGSQSSSHGVLEESYRVRSVRDVTVH